MSGHLFIRSQKKTSLLSESPSPFAIFRGRFPAHAVKMRGFPPLSFHMAQMDIWETAAWGDCLQGASRRELMRSSLVRARDMTDSVLKRLARSLKADDSAQSFDVPRAFAPDVPPRGCDDGNASFACGPRSPTPRPSITLRRTSSRQLLFALPSPKRREAFPEEVRTGSWLSFWKLRMNKSRATGAATSLEPLALFMILL